MTKEEALKILRKDSLSNLVDYYSSEDLQDAIDTIVSTPSLPSNLDEAAHEFEDKAMSDYDYISVTEDGIKRPVLKYSFTDAFKAGAEWMAKQGWIDDGSMPPETKHEGNTMQAHIEWTESKPVLAWDSMYGPCVDVTKNGKWMSEQRGGYTGQVCHGIIAWRPIPEYKEKQ